jgi:hypothetical protein
MLLNLKRFGYLKRARMVFLKSDELAKTLSLITLFLKDCPLADFGTAII